MSRDYIFGGFMLAVLPLEEMSLAEKFLTIEMVWDDIVHNSPDFKSPAWHEEILREREAKIKSGEDKLIDWKDAKRLLRDSLK